MPSPQPVLLTTDAAVQAAAAAVLSTGEYKAGANETVLLHAPAGLTAKRLLIVGLGKQAKATVHSVRNAAGTAVRYIKPRGIRELGSHSRSSEELCSAAAACARAAVEGAFVGDFDPDTYRSDRKDLSVQSFTLAAPAGADQAAAARPPSTRASSSARARTLPAPWSTSPATSSRRPSSASAPRRWPPKSASSAKSTPPKSCTS